MVSRRRYLAVLGASVLAGCSDGSDGSTASTLSRGTDAGGRESTTAVETEQSTTASTASDESPTGEAVAWSIKIGSPLTAAPVVADDRIVLGSGTHDGAARPEALGELTPASPGYVHVVDVDGTSWSRYAASAPVLSVGAHREHGVADGGAYAILGWYGGLGGVAQRLVRVENGRLRWTGPSIDENRFVTAVLPDGVVTGTRDERVEEYGHRLRCRDRSGAWRWEVESGDVLAGTATNGRVYVTEGNGNTRCLDAATGETRWTYAGWAPTWRPRVEGDVVLVKRAERTGLGGSPLVALDAATGERRFSFAGDGETAFTPVSAVRADADGTADAVVYVASAVGDLWAVDADGRGRWRYQLDGAIVDGPEAAGGHAYAVDTSGTLHAVDAESGERAWTRDGTLPATALGASDDGVVLLASATATNRADRYRVREFAHDGTVRFEYTAGGTIRSAFTHDGNAYAVTSDGSLAAFRDPER